MLKEIKKCLLDLYNEYRRGSSTTIGAPLGDVEPNEEYIIQACGGDENKIEMMKELIQEWREQHLLEISNEVDKYFAAPYISIVVGGFDLLNWWKSNTKEFPILSQIAKHIFAIPTSTVASENAFSLARRVADPFRADEVNFYKEPMEDMLQFYKEIEEVKTSLTQAQSSTSSMPPPNSSTSQT